MDSVVRVVKHQSVYRVAVYSGGVLVYTTASAWTTRWEANTVAADLRRLGLFITPRVKHVNKPRLPRRSAKARDPSLLGSVRAVALASESSKLYGYKRECPAVDTIRIRETMGYKFLGKVKGTWKYCNTGRWWDRVVAPKFPTATWIDQLSRGRMQGGDVIGVFSGKPK